MEKIEDRGKGKYDKEEPRKEKGGERKRRKEIETSTI